eukprot:scaffold327_cov257-Pinguiococcus_pyrenoidosus.AAC.16
MRSVPLAAHAPKFSRLFHAARCVDMLHLLGALARRAKVDGGLVEGGGRLQQRARGAGRRRLPGQSLLMLKASSRPFSLSLRRAPPQAYTEMRGDQQEYEGMLRMRTTRAPSFRPVVVESLLGTKIVRVSAG